MKKSFYCMFAGAALVAAGAFAAVNHGNVTGDTGDAKDKLMIPDVPTLEVTPAGADAATITFDVPATGHYTVNNEEVNGTLSENYKMKVAVVQVNPDNSETTIKAENNVSPATKFEATAAGLVEGQTYQFYAYLRNELNTALDEVESAKVTYTVPTATYLPVEVSVNGQGLNAAVALTAPTQKKYGETAVDLAADFTIDVTLYNGTEVVDTYTMLPGAVKNVNVTVADRSDNAFKAVYTVNGTAIESTVVNYYAVAMNNFFVVKDAQNILGKGVATNAINGWYYVEKGTTQTLGTSGFLALQSFNFPVTVGTENVGNMAFAFGTTNDRKLSQISYKADQGDQTYATYLQSANARVDFEAPENYNINAFTVKYRAAVPDMAVKIAGTDYSVIDERGNAVAGQWYNNFDNCTLTWVADNAAGYNQLSFVKGGNKSAVLNIYEYDFNVIEDPYKVIYNVTAPNTEEPIYAGRALETNGLGNIVLSFTGDEYINFGSLDGTLVATLTHNGKVVRDWVATDEFDQPIVWAEDNKSVTLTGVTDEECSDLGTYTLTIPDGFFKQGDVLGKGVTIDFTVVPFLASLRAARFDFSYSWENGVSTFKLLNPYATSFAVTEGATLKVNKQEVNFTYDIDETNEGAIYLDWESDEYLFPGEYKLVLSEGAIRWADYVEGKAENYCFNDEFEYVFKTVDPEALELEVAVNDNNVVLSWDAVSSWEYHHVYIYVDGERYKVINEGQEGFDAKTYTIKDVANGYHSYKVAYINWPKNSTLDTCVAETNEVLVYVGEDIALDNSVENLPVYAYNGNYYVQPVFFGLGLGYDLVANLKYSQIAGSKYDLVVLGDANDEVNEGGVLGTFERGEDGTWTLYVVGAEWSGSVFAASASDFIEIPADQTIYLVLVPVEAQDQQLLSLSIKRDPTRVADMFVNDAEAEFFNLQGVRVANPENGVFVVRKGDKTYKVMIRK